MIDIDQNKTLVLAVVMPVYNHQDTIGNVIEEWVDALSGLGASFLLHVYNDGSTDGTGAILEHLAGTHDALRIHHKANAGHGPTILQGYRENAHATWIFQVDSDDEVSAAHLETFWRHRHTYDFVIANRRGRQASASRKLLSGVARFLVHFLGVSYFSKSILPCCTNTPATIRYR